MSNESSADNHLSKVEESDLLTLWNMRNDPLVCLFAQTNKPVSWQEYEAVFKYTTYPKLVYKDNNNNIIGYVDFRNDMVDDDINVKEWSFFLGKQYRGNKLSIPMLKEAIDWAKKRLYNKIKATVKQGNNASIRVHESLGFVRVRENEEEMLYVLDLTHE